MQPISQIQTFPHKTPIDAVQGKLVGVYEYKPFTGKYDPTTIQSAELQDIAGSKIRIEVWGHTDLTELKGKDVVISANKPGAITVKHNSYTKEGKEIKSVGLSVTKAAVFQLVHIQASNPESKPANEAGKSQGEAPAMPSKPFINGATIGMAINQACANLTHMGMALDPDKVWKIASGLVRVAQKMDQGDLAPAPKDGDVPF